MNHDFAVVKSFDDGEAYSDGKSLFLAVWGYATGSDVGIHNAYDTDVAVYEWKSAELPQEVPSLKSDHWEPVTGIDFSLVAEGYPDWDDYGKMIDEFLAGQ